MGNKMSEIEVVRAIDSRLHWQTKKTLIAASGASYITNTVFSVNALSNTNINITCNPTSERAAFDMAPFVHLTFGITATVTNSSLTLPPLPPSMAAPAYSPYLNVLLNETMNFNGVACVLANPNLYLPKIMQAYTQDAYSCHGIENSSTPNYPDNSSHFLNLSTGSATSTRNPLSSSYDAVPGLPPRGAFAGYLVTSNVAGASTFTATLDIAEQVKVSPFDFGPGSFDARSQTYISTLTYQSTLGPLNKVLSLGFPLVAGVPTYTDGSGTIAVTNISVQILKAEIMFQNYQLALSVPRPPTIIRPFNQMLYFPQTFFGLSLAPGQSTTLNMQNITIGSVPRDLWIWVPVQSDSIAYSTNAAACTYPSSCLQISNGLFTGNSSGTALQVTFDGIAQCQSYDAYTLWKICVKNGCRLTFSEWIGMPGQAPFSTGFGSIVRLRLGSDVVLNEGWTVGQQGRITLGVNLAITNTSSQTLSQITMGLLCTFDGLFVTDSFTQSRITQSSFNQDQILSMKIDPSIIFKEDNQITGAGFFDDLWSGIKSVASTGFNFLKDTGLASKAAAQFGPQGETAANVLRAVGLGTRHRKGGAASSGHYRRVLGGSVEE